MIAINASNRVLGSKVYSGLTAVSSLCLLDTTVWADLLRTNSPSLRRELVRHSKSTIGLS